MTAGNGEPAEVATTTREFINELGNRIKITIEGPNSSSENILTPLEAIELSHGLNEMKQALAADRTKLLALGADPGPTEDELFGNGIINLNSALDLAEDMTVAPGYGDMQDALGVLAKAYRKAEDRIGELLVKNDAKTAALSRAEALLAEAREGLSEAEETLRLVEHRPSRDPLHGDAVEQLGGRIGYGALMSSASASWMADLKQSGLPEGGAFVAGPCWGSVTRALARVRALLAKLEEK